MMGLTRRQRVCLETVRVLQAETGTMPSLEELRIALGLRSKSAVSTLLNRLEGRGAIKRIHGCSRAIVIRRNNCPECGRALKGSR